MYKFKTILIIFSLIFFYFLIGIYFNSASYDYFDTICFLDDFIKGEPRMIFLKLI